jgi:hypothetical protein
MQIAARLCACCLVLVSGCATLFAGGPDKIPVQSNPPGAHVFVDNVDVGVTPTTVVLDRKQNQGSIRVEAPGFQPYVTKRSKNFQPVALLNCLGLVPWVVDLATGNYEAFDDTTVSANLVPAGPAPTPGLAPAPQQAQPLAPAPPAMAPVAPTPPSP